MAVIEKNLKNRIADHRVNRAANYALRTATSAASIPIWHSNTGEMTKPVFGAEQYAGYSFENVRLFIRLHRLFREAFQRKSDLFVGYSKSDIEDKAMRSIKVVMDFKPGVAGLEITYEGELFYTIIKDDLRLYLQHCLLEDNDLDEALVSIYCKDEPLLNYSGSLASVGLQMLQTIQSSDVI
ncbi:MAG TPA: hypothetical protein PL009_11525 [Flavipsychrobacter sp.]|nr:hypothetical protein [Flavipsychrobacter sp.]